MTSNWTDYCEKVFGYLARRSRVPLAGNWMRQFSRKNAVFIHIPKTAGSSIRSWLVNNHNFLDLRTPKEITYYFPQKGGLYPMHQHYLTLLHFGLISRKFDKNSYKFCVTRNPYDRAVSLFLFLRSKKRVDGNFIQFLDAVRVRRMPIGGDIYGLAAANPQIDWIIGHDGKFVVDDIFDISDIASMKETLDRRFNKISPNIGFENKSPRSRSNKEILTESDEIVPIIEEIYAKDFALLHYPRSLSRLAKC